MRSEAPRRAALAFPVALALVLALAGVPLLGGCGSADDVPPEDVAAADAAWTDATGADGTIAPDVENGRDAGAGSDAADSGGGLGDAIPDANSDAASDGGADAPDGATAPFDPPPVAPARDPTPVAVSSWFLGFLPAGNSDPVGDDLDRGTFEMPAEGTDADGVRWIATTADENGGIVGFPQYLGYAAALVPVPPGERLFARADRGLAVYGGGAPQPADVYGHRKMRLPLAATYGGEAGADAVVVYQASGQRGAPEIALWSTPDELVFNLADVTAPDLLAGDATERWLGAAVLNLTAAPALDLRAWVVESDAFVATEVVYPSLPPGAATQVGFRLQPKAAWPEPPPPPPDGPAEPLRVPVTLRLASPSLDWTYETTLELEVVDRSTPYRQTFRSPVDHSVQYYGVQEPSEPNAGEEYALVLSLHGAGVEAIGQARSYSKKSWAYVVAPTNRRPFGFDWEEWGRLNALAALDDATARFPVKDSRVYLTGHSMGGHGTWHVGVTTPTRFAVIGPSAGWASFYTYTGDEKPGGAFGRARAHSDTLQYLTNLSHRGVFIIHGEADDNVPVREGRDMYARLQGVVPEADLFYYEQPGAGHWWDGDLSPGADCVDFPLLFRFMDERRLDPSELAFTFTAPMASYNPDHSFVTLRSCADPYQDCTVASALAADDATRVVLTTDNVRSLVLDGAALTAKGVASVEVDGQAVAVTEGPIPVGPQDGKHPGQYGPYNEVYRRPFCWVYADDAPAFRAQVAYLASTWTFIGNGHSCALPVSALTPAVRDAYNLIYVGVPRDQVPTDLPFEWDDHGVTAGGDRFEDAAVMFVFPEGEGLSAALNAPVGSEFLLSWIVPFSSRSGMPDYLVWSTRGGLATGFFTPDWGFATAP